MNRSANWIMYLAFLVCFASTPSVSRAIDFVFVHEGFADGAVVSGSFSGVDLNGDRQISGFDSGIGGGNDNEITDFFMTFSGNSIIPAFTGDLSSLFGLVYDLDEGPVIGDGLTFDIEGIGFESPAYSYTTGNGPDPFPGGEIIDITNNITDSSALNAFVTVVPEPSSAMIGLLAVVLAGAGRRWH